MTSQNFEQKPRKFCRICKCPWNVHFNLKYRYEMIRSNRPDHSRRETRTSSPGYQQRIATLQKLCQMAEITTKLANWSTISVQLKNPRRNQNPSHSRIDSELVDCRRYIWQFFFNNIGSWNDTQQLDEIKADFNYPLLWNQLNLKFSVLIIFSSWWMNDSSNFHHDALHSPGANSDWPRFHP